jgi:hypothetical protein
MKLHLYTLLFLLLPLITSAKKVITKTNTAYVFDVTNTYTHTYSENGIILNSHTLNTYVSGVEKLESHEVYLWNGKKWKELANKKSYSSDYNTGFYSGEKVIRTQIEEVTPYILKWQKKCAYAIYCSQVYFNNTADSNVVSITLPANLTLAIHWADTIGYSSIGYSITQKDNVTLHQFTSLKQETTKVPNIRILVREKSKLTNEQAFTKAYLKLIEPVLSEPTPPSNWLDSLKLTTIPSDKKVKSVFEYVQNQISYIAITNGLDGLCPRPVSYSLYQKQGDCKAMALVVHKYLNYLNIPNYLAVSATLGYPYKMDFPTISSGNHLVCAYLPNDSSLVVLDATDTYCQYPQPSRHIQSTSILLLNPIHPEFKKVPLVTSLMPTMITMELNTQTEIGYITFSPKAVCKWKDLETYRKTDVLTERLKESLQIPEVRITDVTRKYDSTISYTGVIKIKRNNFLTLNNSLLINQSFLPNPADIINSKRSYSYYPANHAYHIEITLPRKFKLSADTHTQIDTDLYTYSYHTQITEDNILHITYFLQIKSSQYSLEQQAQLTDLQSKIQHDFNTTITLQ